MESISAHAGCSATSASNPSNPGVTWEELSARGLLKLIWPSDATGLESAGQRWQFLRFLPKAKYEKLPTAAKELFYDGRPMAFEGKSRAQCRLCAGEEGEEGVGAATSASTAAVSGVAGTAGKCDGLDDSQFDTATGTHRPPISHSKIIFRSSIDEDGALYGIDGEEGDGAMAKAWVYIGSHNLSATAWGEATDKECKPNNVELGVVLCTASRATAQEWRERMPLVAADLGLSYAAKAEQVEARAKAQGRGKGNGARKKHDMLAAMPFVRGGTFYMQGFVGNGEQGVRDFRTQCRSHIQKHRAKSSVQ
jgi:hypothetical protein